MSEVFEHNPGDHEDPLTGPTWIIGFLGAVLLSVIMLGLTALLYNARSEERIIKVVDQESDELIELREKQQGQLAGDPRWVEERVKVEGKDEEQVVKALVIPINEAMILVQKEYAAKSRAAAPKRQ